MSYARLRATVVVIAIATFWIATAWPSGATAALIGGEICALSSTTSDPARIAFQMAAGTVLAAIAGMVVTFGLYPLVDGFPLLCVVLTPFLAAGAFMTWRKSLAGYGAGYCIFFCFLAGPDNVTSYSPAAFVNDSIALVLAMLVASAGFLVVLPPSGRWMKRVLLNQLRGLVAKVHTKRSEAGLRDRWLRFESSWRDIAHQLDAHSTMDDRAQREINGWLLSVVEVAPALIELQSDLRTGLQRDSLNIALEAAIQSVSEYFRHPHAVRRRAALDHIDRALSIVREAVLGGDADAAHPNLARFNAIACNLLVIEAALRDGESLVQSSTT